MTNEEDRDLTDNAMTLIHSMREQNRTIRRMTTMIDMLFVRVAQYASSDELADIADEIAQILKGDDNE